MDTTTTDDELTALLTRARFPENLRDLLAASCTRLHADMTALPGFVARVEAECPVIDACSILLHVIDSAKLLGSLHGCYFLAQLGLLASERFKAFHEARAMDTNGQVGS